MSNHNTGETMIKKVYVVYSVAEDGRPGVAIYAYCDKVTAEAAARGVDTSAGRGRAVPVCDRLAAQVAPGVLVLRSGEVFVNGESPQRLRRRGEAMFKEARNALLSGLSPVQRELLKQR